MGHDLLAPARRGCSEVMADEAADEAAVEGKGAVEGAVEGEVEGANSCDSGLSA
jgi:hypothetical protein